VYFSNFVLSIYPLTLVSNGHPTSTIRVVT
jgi:hypothetical protein